MAPGLSITRRIRHANRAAEVITVFARYGFGDIMADIGIDRLLERGKHLIGLGAKDGAVQRQPQEVRLRHVLEELGPTFVKLGQVLSMRPDLIPQSWADEFSKLQADVERVPFDKIEARLREAFPDGIDEVFDTIEEQPLAAGSLAQVHRATLKSSGEKIVLKVLRPDIHEIVNTDMELLETLADFAEDHFSNLGYNPRAVVNEFSRALKRELDLTREGRATDRFHRQFRDYDNISFPKVFWSVSSKDVLALEEIEGVLLNRLDRDELTNEELEAVVSNGAEAVFRQCLEFGFFHADPHPGNIFVLPEGKVCFIDCGMTGHIEPDMMQSLALLVQSVVNSDLDKVIRSVISLADADTRLAQDSTFRADVWDFVSKFEDSTFESLDMGELLNEFFARVRKHNLRCPANIVFLIKAITTIEGVGHWLLPSFDLVGHVQPFVERLVRKRYGIRAIRQRIQSTLVGYVDFLEHLPEQLRTLIVDFHHNRLTINLEHRGLDRLTSTIEHSSRNIALALVLAALIVGSSILLLADSISGEGGILTTLAAIGFALTVIMALFFLITNRKK